MEKNIQSRYNKIHHTRIQLIEGDLHVNGEKLSPGDGASADEEKELHFPSEKGAHFLLFNLELSQHQRQRQQPTKT